VNDVAYHSSDVNAVHLALRRKMLNAEWKAGDRLPPIAELAKMFKCSAGTVSKAIALLAHAGFVDQRKKAGIRVLYNAPDQGSFDQKADAFAFIYPSEQHEAARRMVEGFQEAGQKMKCRIVTLTTGTDYRKEAEYFRRLVEFDVKGVLIHPLFPTPQDQVDFSQMLVGSKFPVVLADMSLPGLGCPSISTDGAHASFTLTRHLLDRGCRRIGFFANNVSNANVRDKYIGYRQALDKIGKGEDRQLVFLKPTMQPNFEDPIQESVVLARDYLKRHPDVDGIVCANDFLAHGCLIAARELNIAVPEQIKITGMNDFQFLPPQTLALTTYHFPYAEIGRRAFETLQALSLGKTDQPLDSLVRGTLVVRESA
jgi:GntR family transcriptional regulator, arabinose operon transcriptional repressor